MKKITDNNSLKIIFALNNRESYVKKYLKNIQEDSMNYDLLILLENNKSLKISKQENIYQLQIKGKVNGMNSIFCYIYKFKNFVKNYKYVCFVEDDNFIFNKGLKACESFLDQNPTYAGCNGKSFLFNKSKKKSYLLNSYISPRFDDTSVIKRLKKYNQLMGLVYYSLIRADIFLKICKKINKITDDNLSEIYFNYLLIIFGNLKSLNTLYLARMYPRPKIYNIPKLDIWLKKTSLNKEIYFISNDIRKELKKKLNQLNRENFLKESVFKYLSIRINPKNKKMNFFSKVKLKIDHYCLMYNHSCINFINNQS
jgi:glycosyltransferase domain-containing protein